MTGFMVADPMELGWRTEYSGLTHIPRIFPGRRSVPRRDFSPGGRALLQRQANVPEVVRANL
jgi:hypothetical protein